MDHLDGMGIEVGRAISLWHAAALVWDPGAPSRPSGAADDEAIASDSTGGVTAVVLLDPAGRLIWSWAQGGALIAAGSLRTSRFTPEGERTDLPRLTRAALDRLDADWLAWSAQLGIAPSRVRIVGALHFEAGDFCLDTHAATARITAALPGAAGEIIEDDDPIGLTLRRLAERLEDVGDTTDGPLTGRDGLCNLTNRPGRTHRMMYHAAAFALGAAAVLAGSRAVHLWGTAGALAEAEAEVEDNIEDLLGNIVLPNGVFPDDPFIVRILDDELTLRRRSAGRDDSLPIELPILQELETVSFLLQSQDMRPTEIAFSQLIASFKARVSDAASVDAIADSLDNLAGSNVSWGRPRAQQAGNALDVTVEGSFIGTRPGDSGNTAIGGLQ